MADHENGCGCRICSSIRARQKDLPEWQQEHESHLAPQESFGREPFNHPSGTWFMLVCPCGAKIVSIEESEKDGLEA